MANKLHVGQRAPMFTATDTRGNNIDLERLLENGPVILAFYPKAFTPG